MSISELWKKNASPTGICSASQAATVQREVGERQVSVRHRPVAQLGVRVGEQQITAAAGAHQLARRDIDDVLMLLGDRLGAHLAPLARRLRGDAGWRGSGPARRRRLPRGHHITPVASASTATDSTPSRSSSGIGSRCSVPSHCRQAAHRRARRRNGRWQRGQRSTASPASATGPVQCRAGQRPAAAAAPVVVREQIRRRRGRPGSARPRPGTRRPRRGRAHRCREPDARLSAAVSAGMRPGSSGNPTEMTRTTSRCSRCPRLPLRSR